jgi:hypothetical protein
MRLSHCFAQQAPYPVASHGIAQSFADNESIPVVGQTIGRYTENQKSVSPNTSSGAQALKIFFAAKAQTALHGGQQTLAFPVHFLDVIVHGDCQVFASLFAPGFEHITPATGEHTAAKTMHAQAAANFGLVGAFWHFVSSFKKRAQGAESSISDRPATACCALPDEAQV